jgi:hypothetical protein
MMNAIQKKFVPLVDVIEQFSNSDEGKKIFLDLKNKKEADPARFNLQYSKKLIDEHMAADTNFSCAMHRFIALNQMRSEWGNDSETFDDAKFDVLYEEYHSHVLAAARHIKAYKAHKKMLENAVIRQDKKRKR